MARRTSPHTPPPVSRRGVHEDPGQNDSRVDAGPFQLRIDSRRFLRVRAEMSGIGRGSLRARLGRARFRRASLGRRSRTARRTCEVGGQNLQPPGRTARRAGVPARGRRPSGATHGKRGKNCVVILCRCAFPSRAEGEPDYAVYAIPPLRKGLSALRRHGSSRHLGEGGPRAFPASEG